MGLARRLAVLSLALAVGCSDDAPTTIDAGVAEADGGAADTGIAPPAEPAAAALPMIPCPAGWRSAAPADGDPPSCQPYPTEEPDACEGATAHFVGEPGCAPVGDPCPAGEWPEGLPAEGRVVYVRPGAPAGGSGTIDAPFATIAQAQSALLSGGTIALAKGTHVGQVRFRLNTTVRGACAAETVIVDPTPDTNDPVVLVEVVGARLEDVTVTGERLGIRANAGSAIVLDGVVVAGVRGSGIACVGGTVTARDTIVRDVAYSSAMSNGGVVAFGGSVALERVAIERPAEFGILTSGAMVTLAGVAVRDSAPRLAGDRGNGLAATAGAIVTGERVVVERSHDSGIAILEAGTRASLTDVVIRDIRRRTLDNSGGAGCVAVRGASLSIERARIERVESAGVGVIDAGSEVRLRDVVVTDVAIDRTRADVGWGMLVQREATATVERLFVRRSAAGGIAVITAASLTASDLTVRDSVGGEFGRGLEASSGAHVTLSRALFDGNPAGGVFAMLEGTGAELTDVVVRGSDAPTGASPGVYSGHGGTLSLTRGRIESSFIMGAGSYDGTLRLTDVTITGTTSGPTGFFGRGIELAGGELTTERARLADNRELGIGVFLGSRATLTDVVVEDTHPSTIAGTAVGVYADARVDLRRFLLQRSALCGIQIAAGGQADLHEGTIAHNVCGANVQTVGFDVSRLDDGVRYEDNELNLDTAALPVPDASPPAGTTS